MRRREGLQKLEKKRKKGENKFQLWLERKEKRVVERERERERREAFSSV